LKGLKKRFGYLLEFSGHVAALVRSHMNGLKPFKRAIEQTKETVPPSSKTITAAAMTTNRITSLGVQPPKIHSGSFRDAF